MVASVGVKFGILLMSMTGARHLWINNILDLHYYEVVKCECSLNHSLFFFAKKSRVKQY